MVICFDPGLHPPTFNICRSICAVFYVLALLTCLYKFHTQIHTTNRIGLILV